MQDSLDSYNDSNPVIESEPELDMEIDVKDNDTIKVPENNYSQEVKKLVDVDEKHWNIHTLRVCTKYLTELSKKEFKNKRWVATLSNNFKLEKKILEQLLCNKAETLTPEKFSVFYKKLYVFTSQRHLHPRKKYMEY